MIFLGTEHVALCSKCERAWSKAYDDALSNWAGEYVEAA
jgi:hypothetical protein